jgi:hypothetical protein
MRLIFVFALFVLPACYTDLPADGALRCNTQSAKQCPSGFYCAPDDACWRSGHAPETNGDMSVAENPNDMGALDLSDKNCSVSLCAGDVLRTCNSMGMFDDTSCSYGCSSAGGPHCSQFYPTAPVTPADLTTGGVGAFILGTGTVHGDTGAIDGARAANTDPTQLEVNGGIGFHRVSGVGIFIFGGLTMPVGVTVHLAGPNPIAFVSTADLTLLGVVDAQGPCSAGVSVAGGSIGAPSNSGGDGAAGIGPGAGGGGQTEGSSNCSGAGGGGAGHGDAGGKGGNGGCFTVALGGVAGSSYDTTAITTLRGGSGGGAGGALAGSMGGVGGSGGGAFQLVAMGTITIGNGSAASGVNAGGCGGGAQGGSTVGGGGGGGSGGDVIVEAPTVRMLGGGTVIAANGGGGGGSTNGGNGSFDSIRAAAGGSGATSPGRGGAGAATAGEAGVDANSSGGGSGGGGGAVGRIRISSFGGASIAGGATLSPTATQAQIDAH